MKLNIDRDRMRRLVSAGNAARAAEREANDRVSDAHNALRDADREYRRQCEWDKQSKQALAAQSAIEIAQGLLREARAEQRSSSQRDAAGAAACEPRSGICRRSRHSALTRHRMNP